MSKPIFIVRCPFESQEHRDETAKTLNRIEADYYIILVDDVNENAGMTFELYNANEVEKKDIEEIKKEILKQ